MDFPKFLYLQIEYKSLCNPKYK